MPANSKTLKSVVKILGIILLILFLFIGGCELFSSLLFRGMCGNEIFQEVYSPNNEYKAVVFQRDCGATTDFSTQISILKASAKLPDKSGNIFSMDGHPDWTKVKVNWETNRLVSISYSGNYEIFNKNDTIRTLFTTIEVKYNSVSE